MIGAALVQSAWLSRVSVLGARPYLLWLLVLAWAVVRGRDEGLVWGFVGGFVADILSSNGLGVQALALLTVALLGGLAWGQALGSSLVRVVLQAFSAGLAYHLVLLLALAYTGRSMDWAYAVLRIALPSVALNAVLAPLVWAMRRREPEALTTRVSGWYLLARSPRALLLVVLIVAVFTVFVVRLYNLQFVQGERFRARADEQRLTLVEVPAPRGLIRDRNGLVLVRNVPSFNVVVTPAYLPEDEEETQAVLRRLATLLRIPYTTEGDEGSATAPLPLGPGVPPILGAPLAGAAQPAVPSAEGERGLREMVAESELAAFYQPLVVKRGVDRDTALLIAQEAVFLPGVSVQVDRLRDYPYGETVSQLLGYLLPIPREAAEEYIAQGYDPATDRVGVAGVEATYERQLRGQKGRRIIEEDVLGRQIRMVEEQSVATPGHNVVLTIDLELQQYVEEALRRGMERPNVNSPRGVAIVMNPQTGEVLAMVSLPTYDNNHFARGVSMAELKRLSEDPHRPMINHAVSDALPPGSIFKVVVAAGALQEGVIDPYTRLMCEGRMLIPDKFAPEDASRAQPFWCWNHAGHGWLDVVGGIANSCDIVFYKVGGGFAEDHFEGLGVERIAQYAQLFGLGEPSGIELPGDIGGLVPTADWKRLTFGETWTTGDTYILSIGQGFLLVTPLEMINVFNVVANGGTLYRPRIVHHVEDVQGNVIEPFMPEVVRRLPIAPEHFEVIREGMEGAVVYGTAPRAQIPGLRVAGKTGTAQFCDNIAQEIGICGEGLEQPTHAWFVAFAPVEQPQVTVLVFLYNGGEGSTAAVPVAHDILVHYFGLDREDEPSAQ